MFDPIRQVTLHSSAKGFMQKATTNTFQPFNLVTRTSKTLRKCIVYTNPLTFTKCHRQQIMFCHHSVIAIEIQKRLIDLNCLNYFSKPRWLSFRWQWPCDLSLT